MNKEKEIEEIGKEIGRALGITYDGERLPFTMHTRNYLAKELVDAGYRKADEVRKETAKKIADWLEDGCFQAGLDASVFFVAQLIRESYGVEVDE